MSSTARAVAIFKLYRPLSSRICICAFRFHDTKRNDTYQSNEATKMNTHKFRCFYCNEEGHLKKECPKKRSDYLASLTCYKCGGAGHIKKDCPTWKQSPYVRKDSYTKEANKPVAEKTTDVKHVGMKASPSVTSDQKGDPPTKHMSLSSLESDTHNRSNTKSFPVITTTPSSNTVQTTPVSNGKPDTKIPATTSSLATGVASLSIDDSPSTKSGGDKVMDKRKVPYPPFVDTHCHLEYVFDRYEHRGSFSQFSEMQKYPKNFDGCISTFCDPAAFSSLGMWSDILKEPKVWGTFGIHPHNAKYYYSNGVQLEDKLLKCLEHSKCVAFGEIGLDYSDHSPSDAQTQREIFAHQLQIALPFGKPLVLHCRDAEVELHHILSKHVPPEWFIHLHCYTGSIDTAKMFLEDYPNLYLGVCGNVTNQRQVNVRQVASEVPLRRLLVETDAPYMTPYNLPKAGRCQFSHPALAFYVAKEIARLRKADLVDVLSIVRENTKAIYGV